MKKISLVSLFIVLIFYGCNRKKNEEISEKEKFTKFSFKQFSKNYSFTLEGETAETDKESNTQIISPSLSLKTKTEIIEIKTDKKGKGEIKFEPETKKIKEIIISGNILILYKELSTQNLLMEITCGKLTYIDEKKEMIFEEKPVIKRDKNKFSGELIIYYIESNKVEIKGNVNAEIYQEQRTGK